MRDFAFGTSAQFEALDQALSSGIKYKYADRQLPESCTPATACIWFAKIDDIYCMYIEEGISTNTKNQDFNGFLARGVAKFICMDDMVIFLQSLQALFPQATENEKPGLQPDQADEPTPTLPEQSEETSDKPAAEKVVDKEKLQEIKAQENKVKQVWPEELATALKKRIFGQDRVIEALADKIVINQMRKEKRLLVLAFLGPTATGKSETAKALAELLSTAYARQYGYIEIAGSEFIGEHTVHRFFGAPPGYIGHGKATVFEPVRKNPYHVIVINEIEKADDKILVGLMEAIDTGRLGLADNSKPLDLNQCILLLTSNIPIDMEKHAVASEFEAAEMCRDAFTKHCGRPEISGKIGNFLVFSPLSDDAITDIIVKFVREELASFNLRLARVDEYLMLEFLKHQTRYGARGIRGLVSDSVGRHLLRTKKLEELRDKEVTISGSIVKMKFEIAGG